MRYARLYRLNGGHTCYAKDALRSLRCGRGHGNYCGAGLEANIFIVVAAVAPTPQHQSATITTVKCVARCATTLILHTIPA